MEFTFRFVKIFFYGLELASPLLLSLAVLITLLGQIVGFRESWGRFDSLYWASITATTVGYDDIRPVTRLSRIPSVLIALTATGGSPSSELAELLGSGSFFTLGANFIAPLDIGGGLQAQVEIETANQEAALATYGSIALNAFNEVESALTNETLLLEREGFLADSVGNNESALGITQTQYDVGQVDFLSVLQLQARTLNSQISLIRIKNARLAQRVDLHLALGGSFSE